MSNWKSCGNCSARETIDCVLCQGTGELWEKIPCPLCGGTLSEIRTDGKHKWRHCYSCHMEQEVTE